MALAAVKAAAKNVAPSKIKRRVEKEPPRATAIISAPAAMKTAAFSER
jgi:hypothetical protein